MMALRDALAVALVLDRSPVLMLTPSLPPLNGADLSSVFDLFGVRVFIEPAADRARLQPPSFVRRTVNTVADLRELLRKPLPADQPVYSRVLLSFSFGETYRSLAALAREHEQRAACKFKQLEPPMFVQPFI